MYRTIKKYKKNNINMNKKKEEFIKKGKLVSKKFWVNNQNPITGFRSERVIKIKNDRNR